MLQCRTLIRAEIIDIYNVHMKTALIYSENRLNAVSVWILKR